MRLPGLLHPVANLRQRGAGAVVVEVPPGCAANADAANGFAAGHDGDATGCEGHDQAYGLVGVVCLRPRDCWQNIQKNEASNQERYE